MYSLKSHFGPGSYFDEEEALFGSRDASSVEQELTCSLLRPINLFNIAPERAMRAAAAAPSTRLLAVGFCSSDMKTRRRKQLQLADL
jgi:hypothetical protein